MERRKLPDPTTPRLLILWVVSLALLLWAAWHFFQDRLFRFDGKHWSLTSTGSFCVYTVGFLTAFFLSLLYYRIKFGKFHAISVLRVVRGILSLFLIAFVVFWPITMLVLALNPGYILSFVGVNAAMVLILSMVIGLSRHSEMGFWKDWLNDTLLRW